MAENEKTVEIRIVTNGNFDGTRLYVDGKEWRVKEINFSASIPRRTRSGLKGGRCHFQVQRDVNGEIIPVIVYGASFEKLAEARELEQENGTDADEGRVGS